MLNNSVLQGFGGKYRIRTCEGCYTLAVFETAAFSRSANFPSSKRVRKNTLFFGICEATFFFFSFSLLRQKAIGKRQL